MNKRFCPKCGTEQGIFVKGFCINCYMKDHELVSIDEIQQVNICHRCGKVQVSGKWVEQNNEILEEIINSKLKSKELSNLKTKFDFVETGGKDEKNKNLISNFRGEKDKTILLKIEGEIDNQQIKLDKNIIISFKKILCEHCSKISGSYHEAIIQVRFKKKPNAEQTRKTTHFVQLMLDDLIREDPLAQLVNFVHQKNGFDFLIGSKQAGKKIAETLAKSNHTRATVATKLTGVDKSGKPKIRFTYCIRLG